MKKEVNVVMSTGVRPYDSAWFTRDFPVENKLTQKQSLDFGMGDTNSESAARGSVIRIFPEECRQKILGIGTSLEETSLYNLMKMKPDIREEFLMKLLDPKDGFGMTLFRLTIGTPDFTAQELYSYYDCKPEGGYDWYNETGYGFSIEKDHRYHIVEIIQQVIRLADELGVRDEICFFASPWSPPGWMKKPTLESDSYRDNEKLLKGGTFNSDYTEALATYYVRYLEEYAKLGIPVYAMTLQNEPYLDIDYPSCLMTPVQQARLAKALKERIAQSDVLKEAGVAPKLWGFDHNFEDGWDYVHEISGLEGWKNLDGVAFHSYAGNPAVMGEIAEAFLDKGVYLTERAVSGAEGAADVISWLRNHAGCYCAWVFLLDSKIGTHQWVGTPAPTPFIQNAENPDEYKILPDAYIIGQFARYIRPGYVRVDSSACEEKLYHVACKNPATGEIVLVISNCAETERNVSVVCGGDEFAMTILPKTVATCIW